MSLEDILVDLMVDETLFLLIVRVEPDLTVGVGGVKGFEEREIGYGEIRCLVETYLSEGDFLQKCC